MNFLKKIYPEKKLPKGTFKPAILGKFQFGADNGMLQTEKHIPPVWAGR